MGLFDLLKNKLLNEETIFEDGKLQDMNFYEEDAASFINKCETVSEQGTDGFKLVLEDIFNIKEKGIIVCGTVITGEIHVGDLAYIKNNETGEIKTVTITGIEVFRKLLNCAKSGDKVGIVLSGIMRNEINPGDELYT